MCVTSLVKLSLECDSLYPINSRQPPAELLCLLPQIFLRLATRVCSTNSPGLEAWISWEDRSVTCRVVTMFTILLLVMLVAVSHLHSAYSQNSLLEMASLPDSLWSLFYANAL